MARREKKEGERDPIVQHWISEIEACARREKHFRKEGHRIRGIYSGSRGGVNTGAVDNGNNGDATPFNILFSNTETIAPSLYSMVPRPVAEYRFKDGNPIGVAAAKAAQRMLEFQLDTNIEGYETFNDAMKGSTLDALLPGRGITNVKYDADVVDVPGDDAAEGAEPTPVKNYEIICTETQGWDRYYQGYARKWSKVPWIAYEMHIDKKESISLFGKEVTAKIKFTRGENNDLAEDGRRKDEDERDTGERKTALIYKIWDKDGGRKVRFISPQFADGYLKVEDDPLGLTGFYDTPRPLEFVAKTEDLVPTAMYLIYENQARELNILSVRINRILNAIKAKGIYDSDLGNDVQSLLESAEGELVPSSKSLALSAEKGLDNAIWFWPVDKLIIVLRELMAAREACKQVIYEVTGISDIVRGASKASETLGAQQLKSQWGTLRIKPKQYEVQRYARDLLRMMLEVAANKFSQETWAKMTGLPYLTDMQAQQAQAVMQAAQQAAQMGDQQAVQTLQQVQVELQKPKWSDVLAILQDDVQRAFRIDIETNSTIEPEAAEDQKNISDLMMAIGQFLNGVGPMIAQGVMPFETAQSMLTAITRRFRFGNEIEDQIKQMKPPKPQDDGKAAAAEKQAQQLQQQSAQDKQQAAEQGMKDQATILQLQTQLKDLQAQKQLADGQTQLALDRQALDTEQKLFKLEQKQATESLQNRAASEGQKLDHKKQIVGLEGKQAKTEQVVGKAVDTKMSQAVVQMGQMVEKLVTAVAQQSSDTQELVKAVKAPRKRKAVRGPDGKISETVDELMN